MTKRKFTCSDCEHTWEVPYGTQRPTACPQCKSRNFHRAAENRGYVRNGRGGHDRGGGPPWAR